MITTRGVAEDVGEGVVKQVVEKAVGTKVIVVREMGGQNVQLLATSQPLKLRYTRYVTGISRQGIIRL